MLVESKYHNHDTVYHKYISQVKLNKWYNILRQTSPYQIVAIHMHADSAFNAFFQDRAWARSAFNVTPHKI